MKRGVKCRPHVKIGNRAYMIDNAWISKIELYALWRETYAKLCYYRTPHGEVVSSGIQESIKGVRITSQQDFLNYSRKRPFPNKGRKNV
jgi:hypothetical protein